MSEPTKTTEVPRALIAPFDTLNHTILTTGLCYVIDQYHYKLHAYQELQSVLADTTGNRKRLETKRSLLDTSKEALHHTINKYKRSHTLPESVCDDMLQELEDIR